MARSTRLVILIKNIYTLWGRKCFLLPVTYFPTNLVYPFTLRVTGITTLHKKNNTMAVWICMYVCIVCATRSSNARDGAGRCSSNFLFNIFVGSVSLAFRNAWPRKLFVIVLATHFLFVILNAIYSPFIGVIVFFCVTLLQLLCLSSDVSHYFL